jgi:regulatory protein
VVSAVLPDPRHPGTVRVEVDGRLLLTVREEVLGSLGVQVGGQLREEARAALCREADVEGAYRALLCMLERRPFAVRDLARRLVLRGNPPEAADRAVDRAIAAGLLDDERFARHYVQTRAARGRGPARLRLELVNMGVAAPVVDRILAEELPESEAADRVLALARKRVSQLEGLDRATRLRRLLAYLARRGYTGREVRRLVEQVLN